MTQAEFLEAIAFALEVDKSIVTMDLKIDDIPEWDSLGQLTILTHLDDITGGKASEVDSLGLKESLDEIWQALTNAGLAE